MNLYGNLKFRFWNDFFKYLIHLLDFSLSDNHFRIEYNDAFRFFILLWPHVAWISMTYIWALKTQRIAPMAAIIPNQKFDSINILVLSGIKQYILFLHTPYVMRR